MSELMIPSEAQARASAAESRWFRRSRQPDAALRLFCLPYAGGGARSYRNWHDWLAPDIEVVAVELPGRGIHLRSAAIDSMEVLVDRLLEKIEPLLDLPFALFGHSLGHGIGLEIHEAPRLAKTAEGPLVEGAVVTVEPGIYRPGWGGVRIEDDVHLSAAAGGAQVLTRFPRELIEIG